MNTDLPAMPFGNLVGALHLVDVAIRLLMQRGRAAQPAAAKVVAGHP
ncbi:MAG: hypothetical protein H7248_09820 [Microbacteriaceae bacterium]|nr:hypothetical protein [Microbacteriaceae bacterium]